MAVKRAPLTSQQRERVWNIANVIQRDENGNFISPNGTGEIITSDTKVDIGHRSEFENRYEVDFSNKMGLTQEQHNNLFTNPSTMQIESSAENRSHEFECEDENEALANITAYVVGENHDVASRVMINPPGEGETLGSLSAVNAQTGEESILTTFEWESYEPDYSQGNSMEDFGSEINEATYNEGYSETYSDDDNNSNSL